MGYEFINKLPTPAEIKEQFPLPVECVAAKAQRDEEVKKAISGQSDKFLVIIGPCSADNEDSVLDYTSRLVKLQEDTKDKLILIPRRMVCVQGLPSVFTYQSRIINSWPCWAA